MRPDEPMIQRIRICHQWRLAARQTTLAVTVRACGVAAASGISSQGSTACGIAGGGAGCQAGIEPLGRSGVFIAWCLPLARWPPSHAATGYSMSLGDALLQLREHRLQE